VPIYSKSKLSPDQNYLLAKKIDEYLSAGKLPINNSDLFINLGKIFYSLIFLLSFSSLGILRCTYSQYSSPVFVEYLKDKLEIYVDYTQLNEITIDSQYQVRSVQSVITSICESNLFSKIVIKDPYHQIGLDESSKAKTAFATGLCV
jgi:hypothetical protein